MSTINQQHASSPREKGPGRPPIVQKLKRFYDGELHKLLSEKLDHIPDMVRGGRIDPKILAEKAKKAKFTVYRWMNNDRFSTKAGKILMELSKIEDTGEYRITKEDITPFLLD